MGWGRNNYGQVLPSEVFNNIGDEPLEMENLQVLFPGRIVIEAAGGREISSSVTTPWSASGTITAVKLEVRLPRIGNVRSMVNRFSFK